MDRLPIVVAALKNCASGSCCGKECPYYTSNKRVVPYPSCINSLMQEAAYIITTLKEVIVALEDKEEPNEDDEVRE